MDESQEQQIEEPLAEWQEPSLPSLGSNLPLVPSLVVLGVIALAMVLVAYFAKIASFYIAAVACAAAAGILISGKNKESVGRSITLTDDSFIINSRTIPFAQLAGFWLEESDLDTITQINLELKKPGLLPISCTIPSTEAETRDILIQVLAELESREKTPADDLAKRFRL